MEPRTAARDAALRLLNRITTGAALAAVAGLGLFSAVSAATIPGTTNNSPSISTSTSSSTSSSPSSGLQSSTGVSSSTSPAHVVSGASN